MQVRDHLNRRLAAGETDLEETMRDAEARKLRGEPQHPVTIPSLTSRQPEPSCQTEPLRTEQQQHQCIEPEEKRVESLDQHKNSQLLTTDQLNKSKTKCGSQRPEEDYELELVRMDQRVRDRLEQQRKESLPQQKQQEALIRATEASASQILKGYGRLQNEPLVKETMAKNNSDSPSFVAQANASSSNDAQNLEQSQQQQPQQLAQQGSIPQDGQNAAMFTGQIVNDPRMRASMNIPQGINKATSLTQSPQQRTPQQSHATAVPAPQNQGTNQPIPQEPFKAMTHEQRLEFVESMRRQQQAYFRGLPLDRAITEHNWNNNLLPTLLEVPSMSNKHFNPNKTYWSCEFCEFKNNYKSSLKRHSRTWHFLEIQYFCPSRPCDFESLREDKVKSHWKYVHLGDNEKGGEYKPLKTIYPHPKKCPGCPRSIGSWRQMWACYTQHRRVDPKSLGASAGTGSNNPDDDPGDDFSGDPGDDPSDDPSDDPRLPRLRRPQSLRLDGVRDTSTQEAGEK